MLSLQWRQVDLRVGEVRLDPGTTKNRERRVFYLTPGLNQLLKEQRTSADEIQRQKKMPECIESSPHHFEALDRATRMADVRT